MAKDKKVITCFGRSDGALDDSDYDAMVTVGEILAKRNAIVATGGLGGVGMEAPMRGAKRFHGETIAYTMLGMPANGYTTEEVSCESIIGITLPVVIQYVLRLGKLLSADAFIVAAGGGPGTMVELMAFINLNAKIWKQKKRLAIFSAGITSSWNNEMLTQLELWGVLPSAVRETIIITQIPKQAVNWVLG